MSRKNDERTLAELKQRLKDLQDSKEHLIYLRNGGFRDDRPISELNGFERFQRVLDHSELSSGRRPEDYDIPIAVCQHEISQLENRLSHSNVHNFVSDALDSATSMDHVSGRLYTYSDKNDGCAKAIILMLIICAIGTLIISLCLE